MFYRRKIILALLQLSGGELEKLRLQKLMFLYSQIKKINPEYEFVPYKYGCYSYSLKADLDAMNRNEDIIVNDRTCIKKTSVNFLKDLNINDKIVLNEVVQLYGEMSSRTLVKHTYVNFPYYAINSIVADNILNQEELNKVQEQKKVENETILFTIGYEGISLEKYLNKLIVNDVKVLIDVRKNPLSQKFGFSKSLLIKYCESLNIKYIHIPEVGINSNLRQELKSQEDYDKLFETYRKTTLKETEAQQNQIIELLLDYKRVALTCFEADICQCHRKHLAESIEKAPSFKYQIKHI